jgi:nucleotide-binding universal stress UspA family protein
MHMKILLPVDGSEYTKRTLNYIAAHDELLGGGNEYTIFTTVPSVPQFAALFLDQNMLDERYREDAEEVLRPVRKFAEQQGWTIRVAHAPGDAADAIAALVKAEEPDLIVMGTHGHSAFGNVILGSVASGVLARCKVPVLLVR